MIINFPVCYVVQGKKIGRKHSLNYGFVETRREEIRTVSAEEAPIAARWWQPFGPLSYYEPVRRSNAGRSGPDGFQQTRWFEGKHWKLALAGDVAGPVTQNYLFAPPLDQELFQSAISTGAGYEAMRLYGTENRGVKTVPCAGDPSGMFDEIRKSNREDAFSRFDAALSRCIDVDGHLYVACLEPVLCVTYTLRRETGAYDVIVETDPRALRSRAQTSMIPLTMFDLAVELASCGARPDVNPLEGLESLRPTVEIEGAFSTDWKRYCAVGEILETFADDCVSVIGSDESLLMRRVAWDADDDERYEYVEGLSGKLEDWRKSGLNVSGLESALEMYVDRVITLNIGQPKHTPPGHSR